MNAILLAFLFLSVSLNKEYLRAAFAGIPALNVLVGSYPNFIAAYVISCFAACPILTERFNNKNATPIFVATAIGVFMILTVEEVAPVLGVSAARDDYDVIASAFGSSCAILTFLFCEKKRLARKERDQPGRRDHVG